MVSEVPSQYIDPVGVHIVGSIPLPSTGDVFTTLTEKLAGRLRRIPDGETGNRHYFVAFQREVFAAAPQVIRSIDPSDRAPKSPPSQSDIEAALTAIRASGPPSTHYETSAIASYKTFKTLQDAGKIEKGVKFQVSLPMPISVISLTATGYQEALEPLYEEHLLKALHKIEEEIPHEDLSVQWDMAVEFAFLEGVDLPFFTPWFVNVREGVLQRALKFVGAVSADIEPKDMSKLVDVLRTVKTGAQREIAFVHMPVPIDRTDAKYFEPLKDLELGNTQLYLGLVHNDDLEGTKKRIAAARKVVGDIEFGVATECGMGRTPPDQLDSILEISASVGKPYQKQNGAVRL